MNSDDPAARQQRAKQAPPADQTSAAAVSYWCIYQHPEICAGDEIVGGEQVIYRKRNPADVRDEFDRQTKLRYPRVRIADAPRTRDELAALRHQILADRVYWAARGVIIDEAVLRYGPADGRITVGGLASSRVDEVAHLLDARYGSGKYTATDLKGL